MHYNMINKWSRIADKIHGSKRLYELPRKAPHKVASLDVEACFLERTSAFEQFPKQFSLVNKIVSKYKLQQNIYKEGYLLQDGGDLKGKIENRFSNCTARNFLVIMKSLERLRSILIC